MTPRRSRAPRELYVTPLDVDLLAALRATRSIVEACSRVSISRDRGMYRLRRLARALGAPVVRSRRGGASRGQTVLTALGRRVLSQGAGGLRLGSGVGVNRPAEANVFPGTWRHAPQPRVLLDGGGSLFVTFAAREGEPVRVGIEPEAVVVARERFPSSARNVLRGRIESVHGPDGMRALLRVRVGRGLRLDVAVTPGSLAELGLTPGTSVFLYLKATAVLRLP